MSTHSNDALRDEALDAFLDQVVAIGRGEDQRVDATDDDADESRNALELSDDEQRAAQTRAAALMASRALAPGDMDTLERMFRIWMWMDQRDHALATLDAHEARLLADLSHVERLNAARSCALWRLDANLGQPDQENIRAQLEAAADAIDASAEAHKTEPESLFNAWEHVMQRARQARQSQVYARGAHAIHALNLRQEHRKVWRTYDDASLQLRLALSAEMADDMVSARALAIKSAHTLATPIADQDVDENDWLRLAPDMVRLAPETLKQVTEQAKAALGANTSPACRRDLAVKLARLRARSLWDQGDQAAALLAAQEGRFLLTSDNDDSFSVLVMEWLLAAGREAEAVAIALDSAWNSRDASGPRAVQLTKSLRAESTCAGLWTLVLACAAFEENLTDADLRELGYSDIQAAQQNLLSSVQTLLPGHPGVDVLLGRQLLAQRQPALALSKLERLLDAPELSNNDTATLLWTTRVQVLGAAQGLKERFVEVNSSAAAYNMGVTLSDEDELPDKLALTAEQRTQFPVDAMLSLATRYYERAMLRFEAFFATGQGYVRDGDIHAYSMNCNNLAIRYRYKEQRFEEALALHHKGLASSPFAEHKEGAMWCQYELKRYPEFVEAAEQLWHYAQDHGFSRHDPSTYFGRVGWALVHLNRSAEIEIWLDRARELRRGLSDDDSDLPGLLGCEAVLLDYLYSHKPKDCDARISGIAPLLMQVGNMWALGRLGDLYLTANQPDKALLALQRAEAAYDPTRDGQSRVDGVRQSIANALKAIKKQKPLWRRWL